MIKKTSLFIFFITLLSCKSSKNNFIVLQEYSTKNVYIKPDIYSSTRDSLKIEIPLQLTLENRTNKNFDFLEFNFGYNNKYIHAMDDFLITNKQNKKISRFEMKLKSQDSMTIILRTRATYVSLDNTKDIFKKYSINKDAEKFRDSAVLVSYKQFRKDFPNVIKEFERIPDSIGITTSNKKEKFFKSKRYKINW